MEIYTAFGRGYGSNSYLLICNGEALIIDPSGTEVSEHIQDAKLMPVGILLTHGHFDHTEYVDKLRNIYGIPLMIHKEDAELLTDGKKDGYFQFFRRENSHRPADRLLEDGECISLGGEEITVLHTPGHTRGSVCYLAGDILVSGDTLFANSIGRCDLYGGDTAMMLSSLKRLRQIEANPFIYPGHGDRERLHSALDNIAYLL